MPKILTMVCLALGLVVCGAERTWTGGAGDGLWSTAANWSDQTPPATGDSVLLGGTPQTITLDASTVGLTGLSCSGSGTWTLARTDATNYLYLTGSESTISVAQGTVLVVEPKVYPLASYQTKFVLTGLGTVTFCDYVGRGTYFNGIDIGVALCAFEWADYTDGVQIAQSNDYYIDVRAQSRVETRASDMICNWARIRLEEGAVWDFCNRADTIGGVCGAGVVTNIFRLKLNMKTPCAFTGRMYSKSDGSIRLDAQESDYPLVVSHPDMLAAASVEFYSVTNRANEYKQLLQFAPNVGIFRVLDLTATTLSACTNYPFVLQDLDGQPITLELMPYSDVRNTLFKFTGSGSLVYRGAGTQAQFNERFDIDTYNTFTGYFKVTNALVQVGNNNRSAWFWNACGLDISPDSVFYDRTTVQNVVYPPIYGGGSFVPYNYSADVARTVAVTSFVNSTLFPAESTQGLTVMLCDGVVTNSTLNIRKNATIEVGEGAFVKDCTFNRKNSDLGQFVFSGGFTTNAIFAGYAYSGTAKTPPKPTLITGGRHFFDGAYGNHYNSYNQTGGDVTVGFTDDSGQSPLSNVYWRISGGTLRVDGRLGSANYPRGFGVDASGKGTKVTIRNGPDPYITRIASDGGSHTWRVSQGAEIEVECDVDAKGPTYGTAGTVCTTGLVEVLEGGTFTMSGPFAVAGVAPSGNNKSMLAWMRVDGGTLKFTNPQSTPSASDYHRCTIGRKGATIVYNPQNKSKSYDYMFYLNALFSSDPSLSDSETDGGLDLTIAPNAIFDFRSTSVNTYQGGTVIHGGTAYLEAGSSLGSGNVELDGTELNFRGAASYALATGNKAQFVIGPYSSCFFYSSGVTLTLGSAGDDAVDCVRTNRGVLYLTSDKHAGTIGGDYFKIKMADTPEMANGLITLPIVAVHAGPSGNDRGSVDLLRYDDTKGLVVASYHEGLADATASDVVYQEGSAALTDNRAVHALVFQSRKTNNAIDNILDFGGHQLTLGDGVHPAMLALNAFNSGGVPTLQNGTLDFGASEGVIVSSLDFSYSYSGNFNVVIKGSGGLTLAPSIETTMYTSSFSLSQANVYTGDTEVHGLVFVKNPLGFSTSKVYVRKHFPRGGMVALDVAGTIANDMDIAGMGANIASSSYASSCLLGHAALCSVKGNTLTGTITLSDDAGVCASAGTGEFVFAGRITGPGKMILVPPMTFAHSAILMNTVFTHANDYTGGTVVSNDVTLVLREAGTLGTGPLYVDGVLEVDLTQDIAFGALSGSGVIRISGSGNVSFASTTNFTGTIVRTEGTGDLKGSDFTTTLQGSGSWINTGVPAVLTSENTLNGTWSGTLGEGIDLVKTGLGELNVLTSGALCGSVTVREGTLRLGGFDRVVPIADGLAFRLDAAASETILTDANGYLTKWSDADGKAFAFESDGVRESPEYRGDVVNGHPAVWFEGDRTRMVANVLNWCKLKQVFVVFNRAETQPHDPSGWLCAGVLGWSLWDNGLRFSNKSTWNSSNWPESGADTCYRVNGEMLNKITPNQTDVHAVTFANEQSSSTYKLAIGCYWNSANYVRTFRGLFCELLVYNRKLSETETSNTEQYLMAKWQTSPKAVAAFVPGASVALEEGTCLDLNGASATFLDLTGSGSVTNAALGTTSIVTLAAADTVSHLTMNLERGITLNLGGGVLDLDGTSVHVYKLIGSGRIINGTLKADLDYVRHGSVLIFR